MIQYAIMDLGRAARPMEKDYLHKSQGKRA